MPASMSAGECCIDDALPELTAMSAQARPTQCRQVAWHQADKHLRAAPQEENPGPQLEQVQVLPGGLFATSPAGGL